MIPDARLAQSVEHETLNLRVVGSSPTSGDNFVVYSYSNMQTDIIVVRVAYKIRKKN